MAGFSSISSLITAINTNGQFQSTEFYKVGAGGIGTGNWMQFATGTGNPGAISFSGTAGAAVAMNSATSGAITPLLNVSTKTRHLLSMMAGTSVSSSAPMHLMLCDFLMYYPALVVTGTPTTLNNSVTLPRYATGAGVEMMLFANATLGANTVSLTFSSTGDVNGAGQLNSMATTSTIAGSVWMPSANTFFSPFLHRSAGDTGITSIQSYTITNGTTGTVNAMLVKPLASLMIPAIQVASESDKVFNMLSMPRIYDGACLGFIARMGSSSATPDITGKLDLGYN